MVGPHDFQEIEICATVADLDTSTVSGDVALVLNPLTLYAYTSSGWQVLSSGGTPPAPTPASEAGLGTVELATQSEIEAGTVGILVPTAARLKAEFDRRNTLASWIAPTLQSGWVNFGTPAEVAGYRKTPWGEVQLRGTLKNGTMTDGTTVLNLPTGYRPANTRHFVGLEGTLACRITVESSGNVTIFGATTNNRLSLESVRYDV